MTVREPLKLYSKVMAEGKGEKDWRLCCLRISLSLSFMSLLQNREHTQNTAIVALNRLHVLQLKLFYFVLFFLLEDVDTGEKKKIRA